MIEGDRLEHYCVCPKILEFFKATCPWLPAQSDSHPSLLFFILDPRLDKDSVIALAVLLHVARTAYETRRAARRVAGFGADWQRDVLGPTLALIKCKDPDVGRFLIPPEVRVRLPRAFERKRRR